jgi:DNA polymerase
MIHAAIASLPLSLDSVAKALNLEQKKMSEGRALIRYFSMPCKPTKANGGRTRNLPEHDPEKWKVFKEYCIQDVNVEKAVRHKLRSVAITEQERALINLDREINDRGILIDTELITHAIRINDEYRKTLVEKAVELTGLDNPNSVSQLKTWIEEEDGTEIDTLSKTAIPEILENCNSEKVREMLNIRTMLAKSSVKKYAAMLSAVRRNGRISGLLQFYGASRTGRWAGRLVQMQNLPQNHIPDLDLARQVVKSGEGDVLELLYGNVPDILSQLIRTAFVAKEGYAFAVADFSAIEARVLAWLAGERWRLDVFNSHGKIYEASASRMFKVPIDSITKGSELRQKGKVAELALGYQGSVGALKAMGADKSGLSEREMQGLVNAWREANPNIQKFWGIIEDAAMRAITDRTGAVINKNIKISCRNGRLRILLPSGRELTYLNAAIGENRFDRPSITYLGLDQTTKKWGRLETYGGKLTENVTQAIARDCLAEALLRLDAAGYKTVMHVHDEVIIEVKKKEANIEKICGLMCDWGETGWATGLPLKADGYVTDYYKKE